MGKITANMIRGAAGVLDLFANRPDPIEFLVEPQGDDGRAMRADWQAVGNDIRAAMDMLAPPKGAVNGPAEKGRE